MVATCPLCFENLADLDRCNESVLCFWLRLILIANPKNKISKVNGGDELYHNFYANNTRAFYYPSTVF